MRYPIMILLMAAPAAANAVCTLSGDSDGFELQRGSSTLLCVSRTTSFSSACNQAVGAVSGLSSALSSSPSSMNVAAPIMSSKSVPTPSRKRISISWF